MFVIDILSRCLTGALLFPDCIFLGTPWRKQCYFDGNTTKPKRRRFATEQRQFIAIPNVFESHATSSRIDRTTTWTLAWIASCYCRSERTKLRK